MCEVNPQKTRAGQPVLSASHGKDGDERARVICLPLLLLLLTVFHLPELGLDDNLGLVSWDDGFADANLPPVNDRLARATVPLPTADGAVRKAASEEVVGEKINYRSPPRGVKRHYLNPVSEGFLGVLNRVQCTIRSPNLIDFAFIAASIA